MVQLLARLVPQLGGDLSMQADVDGLYFQVHVFHVIYLFLED
jgi:hypothetical protein